MGFRAAATTSPKPKMLLIASLRPAKAHNLAKYVAGADGGLVDMPPSPETQALEEASQAIPEIPWGGWLTEQIDMKATVSAGCDFVVFPAAKTPLAIPQNDALGKILEVEASLSDSLLRTVDELPVDAVLIADQGEDYLTWHHLMLFQHLVDLLTKPLLVSIPQTATAHELQALWEAGIDGVITEVSPRQPPGRIKQLRRAIDKLTLPSPRKRVKTEALLPYPGHESGAVTDEEEE